MWTVTSRVTLILQSLSELKGIYLSLFHLNMRIALETKTPLPHYKCWYAYDAKKNATVNDLRRAINKDLKLAQSSRDLQLKGGPYAFLPQLPLKGLIQDDDVIT